MARTPTGLDVAGQARKQIVEARTVEELRCAQAVILPLDFGLSMEATSKILGISKGWACQIRRRFILMHSMPETMKNLSQPRQEKVRNNAYMKIEEEAAFLAQFTEKAKLAGVLIVSEIRQALEEKLGHKTSRATTYNLLHRHGWRKLAPDKRHPKADVAAQEDWKKNSRPRSEKLTVPGRAKGMAPSA
jgi:transposase